MKGLSSLARKLRLTIGLGVVKLVDDARALQQLQAILMAGEARDRVNRYQQYGFSSRPKSGAEGLFAAVGGNRNHLVALVVDDPRYRPQAMQDGEVVVYHFEGDRIHFKNGRELHIVSGTRVRVTAPEVIVEASTKVTLQTPLCEISGDLTVQGTVTGGAVKTQSGVDLGSHLHGGVVPGSGQSGGPLPS